MTPPEILQAPPAILQAPAPNPPSSGPSWILEPVNDYVVVVPVKEGERLVSGIVIPDTAKERPSMGDIYAIARDVQLGQELFPGDRVLYGKYSGHEVTIDDESYIVLRHTEILSRLTPAEKGATAADFDQAITPAMQKRAEQLAGRAARQFPDSE